MINNQDKIIRYHIVNGVVKSLTLLLIISQDNRLIRLDDYTVLYKNSLKERKGVGNVGMSRRTYQKKCRSQIYYRYNLYSKSRWDELERRLVE